MREAGHQPADMRVWHHKGDDGLTYAFVQDLADATPLRKALLRTHWTRWCGCSIRDSNQST